MEQNYRRNNEFEGSRGSRACCEGARGPGNGARFDNRPCERCGARDGCTCNRRECGEKRCNKCESCEGAKQCVRAGVSEILRGTELICKATCHALHDELCECKKDARICVKFMEDGICTIEECMKCKGFCRPGQEIEEGLDDVREAIRLINKGICDMNEDDCPEALRDFCHGVRCAREGCCDILEALECLKCKNNQGVEGLEAELCIMDRINLEIKKDICALEETRDCGCQSLRDLNRDICALEECIKRSECWLKDLCFDDEGGVEEIRQGLIDAEIGVRDLKAGCEEVEHEHYCDGIRMLKEALRLEETAAFNIRRGLNELKVQDDCCYRG